jgi:hypothetical protein
MKIELNPGLLQPNRRDKSRWQCPACAETGNDRNREHLKITPQWWGCAVESSREHSRRIIELAGITPARPTDPAAIARRRAEDARQAAVAEAATFRRRETTRAALTAILRDFEWDEYDLWESSPTRIEGGVDQCPRFFINAMFQPSDIVWAGESRHSGNKHAERWKSAADWQTCAIAPGPMIHPGTWKPGSVNRVAENVLTQPWLIADFDECPLTGRKPESPAEIEDLRKIALSVTNWLVKRAGWTLGAIISTGGKGIHVWLKRPPHLDAIQTELAALGLDPALFRKSQTGRLPGQRHGDTGRISRVLWLQNPIS